ncbi:MAG: peptidylprolyl isomerase [Clostridia bacterium]|nr:peptidylprolyl isomerase [Clostridia bacterium]
MIKRYVHLISLICIAAVSLCLFAGCTEEKDDGVFVPNGSLYDGISDKDATSIDEDGASDDVTDKTDEEDNGESNDTAAPSKAVVDKSSAIPVTITVKEYGSIKLNLYPNVAPKTVDNFINLASDGFYDGLIFHRVIKDFMIQGGDPTGTGGGGSDEKITGEFLFNGVENGLSHKRGVISMARYEDDFDSATSQFFICHKDCSENLDGFYAAFGEVTDGMDVVDAIASVSTDSNDKPLTEVVIESITVDSSTYIKN